MKSEKEFSQQLQPALQELEQLRLQHWTKYRVSFVLSAISGLAFFVGCHFYTTGTLSISFFLLAMIANGLLFWVTTHYAIKIPKEYKSYYKENIIKVFVQKLYPKTTYIPSKFMMSYIVKVSQILNSQHLQGEDYFKGQTDNGFHFQFSELFSTTEGQRTDSRLFYIITCPGYHFDEMLLLPKPNKISLANLSNKLFSGKKGEKISLRDVHSEFDQQYDIWSKNTSISDHILKYDLLDAIYKLNKESDVLMKMSFIKDKIYIDLPIDKDFFDTKYNESVFENSFAKSLYKELTLAFSVVEEVSEQVERAKFNLVSIREKDSEDENWNNSAYDHFLGDD